MSETCTSEFTMQSTKSALTYKQLPERLFFWTAVLLHAITLSLAIMIDNLDSVFDFLGSVGCSCIMFLFPGVAYILALKRYGNARQRAKWSTTFFHALAWVFIVLCTLVMTSYFYGVSQKAMGKVPEDEGIESVYEG